jgi:hypothetical protein
MIEPQSADPSATATATRARASNAPICGVERDSILADHVAGLSGKAIAAKYGRSPHAISRIITRLRRAPIVAAAVQSVAQRKADLVDHSLDTLQVAIQDHSDVYKAGSLAVQTLKGCGVFQPDNQTTFNTLVASMPQALADSLSPTTLLTAVEPIKQLE